MNWFIKTASLLTLAAVMSVSCERETVDEGTGVGVKVPDLAVAFNKNVIRNNGETATLKAYYKGEDVTDEAYFFQFLPGKDVPQQMTTNVFSSTEVGEYHFQPFDRIVFAKDSCLDINAERVPAKHRRIGCDCNDI